MRIDHALHRAAERLKRRHIATPWLDAEVLLATVLHTTREHLAAYPEQHLAAGALAAYRRTIAKRAAGEPVAYLTGVKEFYGLALTVNRHVLIPRPETEALVSAVTAAGIGAAVTIADIGTGCGNLAVALAKHLPAATVYAVDCSAAALAVARRNARWHGGRVRFRRGDLLKPLSGVRLDAVVANLPYLPTDRAHPTDENSLAFEPPQALWSGADGLGHYRRFLHQLSRRRQLPTLAAIECERWQTVPVCETLKRTRLRYHRVNETVVNDVSFLTLTQRG